VAAVKPSTWTTARQGKTESQSRWLQAIRPAELPGVVARPLGLLGADQGDSTPAFQARTWGRKGRGATYQPTDVVGFAVLQNSLSWLAAQAATLTVVRRAS
jgi:hypothetical protein